MITWCPTKFVVLLELMPFNHTTAMVTLFAAKLATAGVFGDVKQFHLGLTTVSPVATLDHQAVNKLVQFVETIIVGRGNRVSTPSVVETESIVVVVEIATSFASIRFDLGQYLRIKLRVIDVDF